MIWVAAACSRSCAASVVAAICSAALNSDKPNPAREAKELQLLHVVRDDSLVLDAAWSAGSIRRCQ